ncbi:SCP2 sterol-binding domain-containing protein [Actinoplanes sp. NPDC049802]|uniref:SCP2 sterol-binding domain-containing protein n=1 Tax=Actinoplanes sp. NPDC049802 TaxID=3154742 RepID=UPI0033E65321
MTDFSPESLATIGPKEFTQLVKSTPDSKIAEVMASDTRTKILDEVFNRMPTLFRPAKAGDTATVLHWIITGGPNGQDIYETVIENRTCTVTNEPVRQPKLAMTMDALTFLKTVTGTGNPMMLFMTGKIKAKGDLNLATSIPKLFNIPKG